MNNKYVFDYAYLAEASYADFSEANFSAGNEVNNAIINTDPENPKSESFAELVTQNYTVEAHWKDEAGNGKDSIKSPASGFSGTLFKSVGDGGRYVLAFKGSLGPKDLAIADGNIATDGLAHHQIVDSSSLV